MDVKVGDKSVRICLLGNSELKWTCSPTGGKMVKSGASKSPHAIILAGLMCQAFITPLILSLCCWFVFHFVALPSCFFYALMVRVSLLFFLFLEFQRTLVKVANWKFTNTKDKTCTDVHKNQMNNCEKLKSSSHTVCLHSCIGLCSGQAFPYLGFIGFTTTSSWSWPDACVRVFAYVWSCIEGHLGNGLGFELCSIWLINDVLSLPYIIHNVQSSAQTGLILQTLMWKLME